MNIFKQRRLTLKKLDKKQYTLRAVAKELKTGYGNLCDIENDKQLPSLLMFAKLCSFYVITIYESREYLCNLIEKEENKNDN